MARRLRIARCVARVSRLRTDLGRDGGFLRGNGHQPVRAADLHIARQSDSPLPLVALVAVETLPGLLVVPLAGIAADSFQRTHIIAAADLARLLLMAAILWSPSLPVVLVAAGLHSMATAFYVPEKAGLVRDTVPVHALVPANSFDQAAANLVLIGGPALGGLLLLQYGLLATILIDCASFLISAVLVLTVRLPRVRGAVVPVRRRVADIVSGWRYFWTHPIAPRLCGVFFVGLTCAAVWTPLVTFFVRDHLGGQESVLTYHSSCSVAVPCWQVSSHRE
jgi:hypothetical protein